MGLVTHKNQQASEPAKPAKKKLLTRGPKVEVKEQVSRQIFDRQPISDNVLQHEVTHAVNVRVDNHTRNRIQALQNLGLGDTAKEIIDSLLAARIEQLDASQLTRYNEMVEILERKDVMNAATKRRKKR